MTKRRPELVLQTLAAINVRRWGFPAVVVSLLLEVTLLPGVPLLAEVPLLVGTPLLAGAR